MQHTGQWRVMKGDGGWKLNVFLDTSVHDHMFFVLRSFVPVLLCLKDNI